MILHQAADMVRVEMGDRDDVDILGGRIPLHLQQVDLRSAALEALHHFEAIPFLQPGLWLPDPGGLDDAPVTVLPRNAHSPGEKEVFQPRPHLAGKQPYQYPLPLIQSLYFDQVFGLPGHQALGSRHHKFCRGLCILVDRRHIINVLNSFAIEAWRQCQGWHALCPQVIVFPIAEKSILAKQTAAWQPDSQE